MIHVNENVNLIIDCRRSLLKAVCLTGGCCAIPGVAERLQYELDRIIAKREEAQQKGKSALELRLAKASKKPKSALSVSVRSPIPTGSRRLTPAQRTAAFGNCAYLGGHVMVSMLDSDETADGFVEIEDFEDDAQAATQLLTGR